MLELLRLFNSVKNLVLYDTLKVLSCESAHLEQGDRYITCPMKYGLEGAHTFLTHPERHCAVPSRSHPTALQSPCPCHVARMMDLVAKCHGPLIDK